MRERAGSGGIASTNNKGPFGEKSPAGTMPFQEFVVQGGLTALPPFMLPSLSILIVEDDKGLRQTLGMLLKSAGHRVASAGNGKEALKELDRESIDLIVTDVLMPEKDGLEFIQEVRQKRPFLPIVAMSGGGSHVVDKLHYLDVAKILGAAVSVPKPFSSEQMLSAIDRAWAGPGMPPGAAPLGAQLKNAG
jgi:CheY-like chemotaxis protein